MSAAITDCCVTGPACICMPASPVLLSSRNVSSAGNRYGTSVAQPAPLLYLNSASVPAPALNYRYYFKKIVIRKAVLFFSVDN